METPIPTKPTKQPEDNKGDGADNLDLFQDKEKESKQPEKNVGENNNSSLHSMDKEKNEVARFGMRPASSYDLKPRATGSNLKEFEKFLVQLKLINIPSTVPGVMGTTKLASAKVMDKLSGVKKLEPALVYGSKKNRSFGMLGMNEQFVVDGKVPIQLWFPKDSVKENDTIKATSEEILVNDNGNIHVVKFYFFEHKGGKTLKEQIEEKKEMYGYDTSK